MADRTDWFTRLYDPLMVPIELLSMRQKRAAVVSDAAGQVLEVGAGTGLNLPHYQSATLVVATDPSAGMLMRARPRAAAAQVPVLLALADAAELPFADASFDTAVATCAFCTVPNPAAGFRELHRVLKPGGELRLLEHIRSPSAPVARMQDCATPCWSRIAGGCRLNRPTLETAQAAGFRLGLLTTRFGGTVIQACLSRR